MLSASSLQRVRLRARRGLTLIELVISLVMLGLMGGLVIGFLLKQERFYTGANEMLLTRTAVRQAAVMMPSDLRAISPGAGDIYAMSDTMIEFRSTFGGSFLCSSTKATAVIVIPPVTLAKGSAFTSWTTQPGNGDSLMLYVDSTSSSSKDDTWSLHKITATSIAFSNASPGCLSATGMMKSTDPNTQNPSFAFTINPVQSGTVSAGAAVRFFKKVHYSLYKNTTDNLWYLGYYDCRAGRVPICNNITPVAGPLRPYVAGQPSQAGLRLTYYDTTGAVTANKALVSRISILLQGEGAKTIQLAGGSPQTFRDSVRIEVALRNWK